MQKWAPDWEVLGLAAVIGSLLTLFLLMLAAGFWR